jgi:hypothetical protein
MSENIAVARALGSEPVVVRVVAVTGSTAMVARTDRNSDRVIGWPLRDLYAYEEALYRKLKQTFVRGEESVLRVVWSEAVPYAPPGSELHLRLHRPTP